MKAMLEQVFTEEYYTNTILYTDQGWKYKDNSYHLLLESKGIQTATSRKETTQITA